MSRKEEIGPIDEQLKDPREVEIVDSDENIEIDFKKVKEFILNNLVIIICLLVILAMLMYHDKILAQCNGYYQNLIQNLTNIRYQQPFP